MRFEIESLAMHVLAIWTGFLSGPKRSPQSKEGHGWGLGKSKPGPAHSEALCQAEEALPIVQPAKASTVGLPRGVRMLRREVYVCKLYTAAEVECRATLGVRMNGPRGERLDELHAGQTSSGVTYASAASHTCACFGRTTTMQMGLVCVRKPYSTPPIL
jgi:hypothetical protein